MKATLFLPILMVLASCTSSRGAKTFASYSFEDFEKVWSPYSAFIQQNENKLLALLKGPEDKYARVYSFDLKARKLNLEYDAGKPIAYFMTDPLNKHFYLAFDQAGDENYEVYEYLPDQRVTQKIFGHIGFQARPTDFSEDGERIYFVSNHEEKALFSLYLYDRKTKKFSRLSSGINVDYALVSPKEDKALLVHGIHNSANEIHLLSLNDKTRKKLKLPSSEEYNPNSFHPKNSNLVLMSTDAGSDRRYCALLDLRNGRFKKFKADGTKDISCGYSSNEKVSVVSSSFNAREDLQVWDGFFEKKISLPEELQHMSFSVQDFSSINGRSWTFVARSSDNPGTLYHYTFADQKLQELMKLNSGPIKEKDFASSYDFFYPSFDKKKIHAVYFAKREWINGEKKYPVILWPHGGPDWLTEHDYNSTFQYWVNRGYIVLGPNFRGSTGYGKAFEKLNDKDWGGGHIKDLIWAKREFSKLPFVDPENFFIVGRSFGGYSVLSAITQYPKEFRAAEATVAIGNLFTFMKSIPPDPSWTGEFFSEVGDPVKDKKLFQERSPIFYAQNISIPLKINQAENDVRTVLSEMDAFVARLKELKIPVDYTVYKGEGHSFRNRDNIRKMVVGAPDFLDKHQK